jgi:glycosyltransferase involved in cell wall biosynthesis
MTPLVSVVIPTYNRAADLARALRSVIDQSWANWEALVVDNHSADDTAAVVEGFHERRIRFLSVHNHGVIAVSRNLGIREARGEYVAFLDSDDWWLPKKLERSVLELQAGADVVYHDLYIARAHSSWWSTRRARTHGLRAPVFQSLIEHGNALLNSSVVVRRSLLLAVGGLSDDPEITAWEDYDCWLRLARVTNAFRRITPPLGYYWLAGNNTCSPERLVRNLAQIRELYLRPIGRGGDEDLPAWFHYSMARALRHRRAYQQVLWHMSLALRGRLPPRERLKALVTCVEALVQRRRRVVSS